MPHFLRQFDDNIVKNIGEAFTMATPMEKLLDMRRKAVFRVFEQKFKKPIRITVGSATCENAAGAVFVYQRLQELLKQHPELDVTIGQVGCAGRCDLEPLVTVVAHHHIPVKYTRVTPEKMERIFESHILNGKVVDEYVMKRQDGPLNVERVVTLCSGARCLKNDCTNIEKAFIEGIKKYGLGDKVVITRSACQGLCEVGPVAYVHPDNVMYQKLTPEIVDEICREHFVHNHSLGQYAWTGERLANRFFPFFGDVHFFGKQLRLTLRNCGVIDPESLDEYLSVRGYEAIAKVLTEMTPQQVIDTVSQSGLRGRGGGGFPTGKKWQFAFNQKNDTKYMICNADEGDPGAFMDRSAIEGDPHTILEGLMIAGFAIGAKQGFVYIRAEYPLAVVRLEKAIAQAREVGLLGKNILGSGFDFDIEIRLGAGAFVCGEETALIHSIEGTRGMPSPRPPYPAIAGLWGKPTVINNVETLANIPVIILDGAKWFRSLGTEGSKGTKVFALAGKVRNTGLVEVPMGTTLREVVYDVGGGIKDGKDFKAVQTGGPAGGCLPESYLNTPVDYDSLTAAGSIMGSGGMIIMDSETCMVDVAKFFLDFTQSESCGKCTPCREGTRIMLEILKKITDGHGEKGDIEKLEELGRTIRNTSLCGLGQCAPNPVLSTLKYFRHEYEAHVYEKKCPAGVCSALVTYHINPEKCVGCTACRRKCPVNCITGDPKKPHVIDPQACVKCGTCLTVCKFGAVIRS